VVEAEGFARYLSDPLSPGMGADVGEVSLRPLGWTPTPETVVELNAATVAGWCAEATDPGRHGVVVGQLRDRESQEPLPAYTVQVEWGQADTLPRLVVGGMTQAPYRVTRTLEGGLFYFCDVPAGEEVTVLATLPDGEEVRVPADIQASTVHRVDVELPLSRPGERAGLFGRVVEDGTGVPVPQARVSLAGERRWALTNQVGFFSLEDLPPGVQLLEVSHLGYEDQRYPVVLEPGWAGQVTVPVAPQAIELEGIEVTVRSSFRQRALQELERRRSSNNGTFFDAQEIERRGMYYLGDVLLNTPNLMAVMAGNGVNRRFLVRVGGEVCSPMLFLNGRRWWLPNGLMEISASEIEVVEVHRAPNVPPEFVFFDQGATSTSCGVVSAWTKAGR
jgi:hypothetical protein